MRGAAAGGWSGRRGRAAADGARASPSVRWISWMKVKSSVKYHCINPEWNEELTLSITNMMLPVKIEVFDKDTFTKDDSMGDAEFCILDFVEIAKKDLSHVPDGSVMKTIHPEKENCFATESHITWKEGKVSQDIVLRLRNTETGEIILHLQWVNIPGVAR